MKFRVTHADSDSAQSPSDVDDKRIGVAPGEFETVGRMHLQPDPDAGLSEVERETIVSESDSSIRAIWPFTNVIAS